MHSPDQAQRRRTVGRSARTGGSEGDDTAPVAPSPPVRNRILSALPGADFRRLVRHLKAIRLEPKQTLYVAGDRIQQVYFPDTGVVSVMAMMGSGAMAEVLTIGNEGLTGLPLFFGQDSEPSTIVRVPGQAHRMAASRFKEELARTATFHRLVGGYAHAQRLRLLQAVACNQLHSLQERTCKWLLMTHDRVEGEEFALTHESLSLLLGARRPTISAIANKLQNRGWIHYRHGRVTILDRGALEGSSCECFQVIRDSYDRLLRELHLAVSS
jgi:CRP-like cAMP-binding protein